MLRLRTKTPKTVPAKAPVRGTIDVIIHFIVDGVLMDKNGITTKGYYYYYDQNGNIVKLDDFGPNATKSWDMIIQIENNQIVPALNSNINLYDNIMQRLEEFTELQQHQETGLNYGIVPEDLEADIDIE